MSHLLIIYGNLIYIVHITIQMDNKLIQIQQISIVMILNDIGKAALEKYPIYLKMANCFI